MPTFRFTDFDHELGEYKIITDSQGRYTASAENGLFNICLTATTFKYDNLVDLDGNTWSFTKSGNNVKLTIKDSIGAIIKNEITVYTQDTQYFRPAGSHPAIFIFFLTYDDTENAVYLFGNILLGRYYNTSTASAYGTYGMTNVRSSYQSVSFPNYGNWPVDTSLQSIITYDTASPFTPYCRVVNFSDQTHSAIRTIYNRGEANTEYFFGNVRLFTREELVSFFPNSFTGLGKDISNYVAVLNRYNWRYTGEFITPTLTITNPETQEVLVENTDYTKTYTNNLNAGTANVLAAGIGEYTGSKSIDFYIIANDLETSVNCTLNKYTWEYTGEFITPEVQVWDTLEEVQLVEGVDYQKTYTNNLNVGNAFVTIVGINNWSGSVQLDFTIISGDDPYNPDDPSGPSGGEGDHDDESDEIEFPTLPTVDAVDTGFCTIYVPTLAQLNAIATYMWATDWTSVLNKLVANPIDTILGLSIVPCAVSYTSGRFVIGNYDTSLTINIASSQFVMVDCGNLTIEEYWGAYMDYSPYTKIDIYLPFIGIRQLNPDDVMGKQMRLHYYIDIVSGQCMAIIRVDGSVLYSFSGSCSITLPITSNNYGQVLISTAVDIVKSGSVALSTGSPAASASSMQSLVNISKDQVDRSGSFSGHSGFLGIRTPYVIITRPRDCVPQFQNKYTGYPVYSTVRLDQLTGFTKVSDIQLDTVPATQSELDELYNILTEGFIIQ